MAESNVVREIRKATRRRFTAEQKIQIVLEGLRGEIPVVELCRREGIAPTAYYRWSKAFLESGKNGLTRDTKRDATSEEVQALKEENEALRRAAGGRVRARDRRVYDGPVEVITAPPRTRSAR